MNETEPLYFTKFRENMETHEPKYFKEFRENMETHEPKYFKKFREHIDHKIETHEPQYFKEFKEHINKTFATKGDLDNKLDSKFRLYTNEIKQHMTDLRTGFEERVKGACDQIAAIDEKVTKLDERVVNMDNKLTSIGRDVFYLKGEIKDKTNKKTSLELENRIILLEAKVA